MQTKAESARPLQQKLGNTALIDAFEAQRLEAIPGGAVRSKRRECFPSSLDGPRTMRELDPSASS